MDRLTGVIQPYAIQAPMRAQTPALTPLRPLREMKRELRSIMRLMSCRVSRDCSVGL